MHTAYPDAYLLDKELGIVYEVDTFEKKQHLKYDYSKQDTMVVSELRNNKKK